MATLCKRTRRAVTRMRLSTRSTPFRHNATRLQIARKRLLSSSAATPEGRGSMRKLWAAGGLLGGAATAYWVRSYINEMRRKEQKTEMKLMPEPAAFVHPYENHSWYYKMYVRTKRAVFLAFIFAPCAVLYGLAEWTESGQWREYWLKILVSTVERSGCSVQKFAQWCSMRPDMFPADVVEALSKLRCDAPPHDYEHTRKVIRESFGREIEDIFESFEEAPVASGTVAQVHRARLKAQFAIDGKVRDVAVKVQHPYVLEETFFDADLLFHIVNLSEKLTVPMKKEDFLQVLQRQTNFEWEAYNLRKFAYNFSREISQGEVKFPDVSLDLLSPEVLVESWANGFSVGKFLSSLDKGITDVSSGLKNTAKQLGETMTEALEDTKRDIARTIFNLNIKMFLRDNLIHSDMHAGNILFSEETGDLTVLDAGQTASLRPDVQNRFGQFLHSICMRDQEGIVENLVEFDEDKGSKVNDMDAFRRDVDEAMQKFCPEGQMIIVGDFMGHLFFVLNRHNLTLRSDVSVSLMSMAVSEGLIRSLDPDFDLVGSAMPYIAKYGALGEA